MAGRLLWLQQYVDAGELTVHYVQTAWNPADTGTKGLDGTRLFMLLGVLRYVDANRHGVGEDLLVEARVREVVACEVKEAARVFSVSNTTAKRVLRIAYLQSLLAGAAGSIVSEEPNQETQFSWKALGLGFGCVFVFILCMCVICKLILHWLEMRIRAVCYPMVRDTEMSAESLFDRLKIHLDCRVDEIDTNCNETVREMKDQFALLMQLIRARLSGEGDGSESDGEEPSNADFSYKLIRFMSRTGEPEPEDDEARESDTAAFDGETLAEDAREHRLRRRRQAFD